MHRENLGKEAFGGEDSDPNVYSAEDDEGTYDPNVYGNQVAPSSQNDSQVLMTVATVQKKSSKHRVMMSSGKKDPTIAGKSIKHNSVQRISFKDKGQSQLMSSTEFEKSVAAECDVTLMAEPQPHHPSQHSTNPVIKHPKKGAWQSRQISNRTPTDQQEMPAKAVQSEAREGDPSPYANQIPVGLQTSNQTKRPSESQQRMRSFRVSSAIPPEESDANQRNLNEEGSGAPAVQRAQNQNGIVTAKQNPQQTEQPQIRRSPHLLQQTMGPASSRQGKKRALVPGFQQLDSFYMAQGNGQQQLQQNLHRESTETTRSGVPMTSNNFLQQSNQFKGQQQEPPGSKQFGRGTAKRNKREKQQSEGGWTNNSSQLAQRAVAGKKNQPNSEYSPENNNHNTSPSWKARRILAAISQSTAGTVSGNNPSSDLLGGHGTFQITVSKKQQVQQFLTKEVKPDQTSLWVYNFNDYGHNNGPNQAQNQQVVPPKQRPDSKSFSSQQQDAFYLDVKNGNTANLANNFYSKQEIRYLNPQNSQVRNISQQFNNEELTRITDQYETFAVIFSSFEYHHLNFICLQVQNHTPAGSPDQQPILNASQIAAADSRGIVTGGRFGRVVLGDRVPSRQSLTRGSRRGTRGALDPNGSTDERQPQPGISTDPNEFGGPIVKYVPAAQMQQNNMFRRPQQEQAQMVLQQNRLGSPFTDLQKRQTVTLPSLSAQPPHTSSSASGHRNSTSHTNHQPSHIEFVAQSSARHQGRSSQGHRRQPGMQGEKKGPGRSGGSAGGQRSNGTGSRSPMRKTAFGVIMEMIKEEEV